MPLSPVKADASTRSTPEQEGAHATTTRASHAAPQVTKMHSGMPDNVVPSDGAAPHAANIGPRRARYHFPKTAPPRNNGRVTSGLVPMDVSSGSMPLPPIFGPKVDEDELDRRFEASRKKKRRSLGVRVLRAGVWIVLALLIMMAGLIAMVWVEDNGGIKATVAMMVSKSVGRPERKAVVTQSQPNQQELPYDGLSAEDADRVAARAAIPIDQRALRDDDIALENAEAAKNAANKSASGDGKAAQSAAAVTRTPEDASKKTASPATDDTADKTALDAAPDTPVSSGVSATGSGGASNESAPPDTSSSGDEAEPRNADKPALKAGAQAAPKPSASPQRVARGKEISRMQHQAAEELKKKIKNRRSRAIAYAQAKRNGRAAVKRQKVVYGVLVRCARIDNVFRRERCKWKICNGKWGKSGCPSYASKARLAPG